jgi:hypothetical protein
MANLIIGFILGVAATTIGFSGIARYADDMTHKIQRVMIESSKGN